ncbi:MAG: T9SS type A sorting domain-containing protein [Bacteroidetes bacterium]|nr:T9SS type A sorting domain-containing protein [Bacteroidota bacterium]
MLKQLLILAVLLSIKVGFSQDIHFIKSYGNTGYDYGRDIKQTPDTGYIATGSSSSFGSANADAFLLKVDSLGNFKWSYNYGGPDSDWGTSVIVTNDSSYAIGGYTNSFGAGGFDFYLVRADENGVPLWEKTYGGSNWDKGDALVQVAADSGFVIVGETYSYGAGGKDMYIVRTDKNGDTLWTKTYGGVNDDWATGVLIDGDSIAVCGGTESYGAGMADGILLKMDMDGNIGWVKIKGQEMEDYFTAIEKFSASYYLSGSRDYNNGIYLADFWIYRIAANGTLEQVDTSISNASHEVEIAHDLTVAQLGNIYFAGQTKSFGYSTIDLLPDAFVGKLLTTYFTAYDYRQNFGEAGTDIAWGIDKCYDEGTVTIGDLAYGSTGGNNMFILKLNKTANFPADSPDYDIFSGINNDITTSVVELSANLKLKIYPNPVSEYLTVEGAETVQSLQIYDISGKCVQQEYDVTNSFYVGNLPAGFYVIKLQVDGEQVSFRMIKH